MDGTHPQNTSQGDPAGSLTSGRPAILSGWYFAPYEAIGGELARHNLRRELTFRSPFAEPDEPSIEMFRDWQERGYFGVPRAYGLAKFSHLALDDRTTMGAPMEPPPRLPNPYHPSVRNPAAQAKFMEDLERTLRAQRVVMATAPTGSGKTVCALKVAAALGRRTLVQVHLDRLLKQWLEEIEDKLGIPPARIGIVKGRRCDWQGKDIVVGMYHSLALRRYPEEFYRAFGFVIKDEVHKVGTKFFAPTCALHPAAYILGLSATTDRDDGGHLVYQRYLGPVSVTSEADALPITVYSQPYQTTMKLWGRTAPARSQCLSKDPQRNAFLTRLILRLYRADRTFLVVSSSVEHLQRLMHMAETAGVPREIMGQFTGIEYGPRYCPVDPYYRPRTQQEIDANAPLELRGWTPRYDEVERDGRVERRVVVLRSQRQIPDAQLDDVKANAKIIFATYGMMTEGIDIPRLDAGLDATPMGKATQLIGRVRRPRPGKKPAIWVTPVDLSCPISMRQYAKRCKDYEATGARIVRVPLGPMLAGERAGVALGVGA